MADFTLKRNDRLPKLRATLQQGSPATPIDLTTASSVKLILKLVGGATLKQITCTIITANAGIVEAPWGVTDTDTSGTYNGEFEINWGAGVLETVPNDGYFTVTVVDDLA